MVIQLWLFLFQDFTDWVLEEDVALINDWPKTKIPIIIDWPARQAGTMTALRRLPLVVGILLSFLLGQGWAATINVQSGDIERTNGAYDQFIAAASKVRSGLPLAHCVGVGLWVFPQTPLSYCSCAAVAHGPCVKRFRARARC